MTTESIEQLAAAIGESVYIDVAKWNLYLRDAKLHTLLAERIEPLLSQGELSAPQVNDLLKSISVKLGGGKAELPLADLMPPQSQTNLMNAIADFQRDR